MKILILVPEGYSDEITVQLGHHANNEMFKISSDVQLSKSFDRVLVYAGFFERRISAKQIKEKVGNDLFVLLRKGATLVIPHHYTCDYSEIRVKHLVITRSQLNRPYDMLKFLLKNKLIERSQIKQSDKDFVLTCDSQILLYVASRDNTEALDLMPVLPLSTTARRNFDVKKFFRDDYCDIKTVRKIGRLFWSINYYQLWGSFYDTHDRY